MKIHEMTQAIGYSHETNKAGKYKIVKHNSENYDVLLDPLNDDSATLVHITCNWQNCIKWIYERKD